MLGMRRPARDMAPEKLDLLGQLFSQWIAEEKAEPEHAGDQLPSAAGTMMMTKDGKALFVRRAAGRDHAGHWSIPGGMTEDDEMPWQTAMRETNEEVGDCGMEPRGMRLMDHQLMDNVGFTTYGHSVDSEFEPTLDEEHDAYMWSPIGNAPHPLHPGLEATLKDYTQDPLTDKGSKIMEAMKKQYGPEKGEQVFYASKNKGNIEGVDGQDRMVNVKLGGDGPGEVPLEERFSLTPDGNKVIDKHSGMSYNIDDIGRILFSPNSMDAGVNKPSEVNVNKPTVETANWRPPKFGVSRMQNDDSGGYSWRVPRYGAAAIDEVKHDPATGRFTGNASNSEHAAAAEHHENMAIRHERSGNKRSMQDHSVAARMHQRASRQDLNTPQGRNISAAAVQVSQRLRSHHHGQDGSVPSYGRDAGTSEGAKKAAQTRAAHGGGFAPNERMGQTASGHGIRALATGSGPVTPQKQHYRYKQKGSEITTAFGQHSSHEEAIAEAKRRFGPSHTAEPYHTKTRRIGDSARDDGMWRTPAYGRDAGTSEGAKKAAQTRKSHGGGSSYD